MARFSVARVLTVASLAVVMAACGGERDREEGPGDRDRPSLGAPRSDDDDDRQEKREEKESREDDDQNDDDD